MSEDPVVEHLTAFPEPQRTALIATSEMIARALPRAQRVLSYGMPTFKIDGIAVVGFEGFRAHNSLFPYSGSVVEMVAGELPDAVTSKGTVRFPMDQPFPRPLLRRILSARVAEINASFPKANGQSKKFFDNGFLAFSGRVREGQMHGAWTWYRRDGSPLRSGSFDRGVQVGEWCTYDRNGEVLTTSRPRPKPAKARPKPAELQPAKARQSGSSQTLE